MKPDSSKILWTYFFSILTLTIPFATRGVAWAADPLRSGMDLIERDVDAAGNSICDGTARIGPWPIHYEGALEEDEVHITGIKLSPDGAFSTDQKSIRAFEIALVHPRALCTDHGNRKTIGVEISWIKNTPADEGCRIPIKAIASQSKTPVDLGAIARENPSEVIVTIKPDEAAFLDEIKGDRIYIKRNDGYGQASIQVMIRYVDEGQWYQTQWEGLPLCSMVFPPLPPPAGAQEIRATYQRLVSVDDFSFGIGRKDTVTGMGSDSDWELACKKANKDFAANLNGKLASLSCLCQEAASHLPDANYVFPSNVTEKTLKLKAAQWALPFLSAAEYRRKGECHKAWEMFTRITYEKSACLYERKTNADSWIATVPGAHYTCQLKRPRYGQPETRVVSEDEYKELSQTPEYVIKAAEAVK